MKPLAQSKLKAQKLPETEASTYLATLIYKATPIYNYNILLLKLIIIKPLSVTREIGKLNIMSTDLKAWC